MMNNDKRYERYQRQILLKEFGVTAQQKLMQAKVLVVGAGGLGCPAFNILLLPVLVPLVLLMMMWFRSPICTARFCIT